VGERLRLDEEVVEVVGVVGDSKYMRLGEDPQPFLYLPLMQRYSARGTVYLRTVGDPAQLAQAVRREVSSIDRMLPVTDLSTISEALDQALWAPRMSAAVLSLLSFLALALAVVGIYGVTAYGVARRRLEIGVRIAVGGGRARVVTQIFQKSIAVLAAGTALGFLGAFMLNRWISSLLYGVAAGDLATFAGVLAVLLGTGALAILVPAFQACRIDPVTVLRSGGDPA
jgi:putative ABC transport system permease protein